MIINARLCSRRKFVNRRYFPISQKLCVFVPDERFRLIARNKSHGESPALRPDRLDNDICFLGVRRMRRCVAGGQAAHAQHSGTNDSPHDSEIKSVHIIGVSGKDAGGLSVCSASLSRMSRP